MKLLGQRGTTPPRRNAKLSLLRLKKAVFYASAAIIVLGGGFYGWHTGAFARASLWARDKTLAVSAKAGFRVDQILVTGREHVPPAVLMAHLGVAEGEPIFSVSPDDAQKSLMDISWIKAARVTRRLPDSIVVELTERTPAALWQHQNDISVIAQDGRVLSADGRGAFANLPLVVGENAPAHLDAFLAMLHAEPLIARRLVSAVRIGHRRWDLHLKDGITVKLPEQNPELALSRLAKAAKDDGLLNKDITSIDLRLQNEIAIEPAGTTATPAQEKKKST